MDDDESCRALGCFGGTIDWDVPSDGSGNVAPPKHRAGKCRNCATLHVECGECGHVESYDPDDRITCAGGCGTRFSLDLDKGDVTGFRELPLRSVS